MKTKYFGWLLSAVMVLTAVGCNYNDKDDDIISRKVIENIDNNNGTTDTKDYTIWEFVHAMSSVYYLWNENVPSIGKIDYAKYESPEALFESFRHEDDRFSAVFSNYSTVVGELSNSYETDGINYHLYLDNGDNVIALVQYVYDDSPAKAAGIERGFVIHKVNGTQLTVDNYSELLDQPTCAYTYSVVKATDNPTGAPSLSYGDDLKTTEKITKIQMDIDPILLTKVFTKGDRRIGYLLYDGFTDDPTTLLQAMEKFEAQQVNELVLDLRFNGGGYVTTLDTLASILVPDGNGGKTFITETYNSELQAEFRRSGSDGHIHRFAKNMSPKLELNNLYVLTSGGTASASEELISGLSPYMPVTLIGETTYGKFTANSLFGYETVMKELDDSYVGGGTDDDGIPYSEWALYLSISSCKNCRNEMNFKNGFTPDYEIKDTYQYELGDENEPLLAKALELCTGTLAKSTTVYPEPLQGYVGFHGPRAKRYGLITNMK